MIIPLVASLALLVAGHRWHSGMGSFSKFFSFIVMPIQSTVDLPAQFFYKTRLFFGDRLALVKDNADLKQHHIYLQAQIQKLRSVEAENHELRELLGSVEQGTEIDSFSEGKIIKVDIDPFSQQILINRGKQQNIEVGQPVIDSDGLVGGVLEVNEYTSRVLLLTDLGFSVPVQSVRSGERAIATGSGTSGELRLNYVPRTADFIEGDQLVTSGLGGRFPAGYPVGVITSIQHDPSTRFTLIAATPCAKLGQLRHVLFVKHQHSIVDKTPENIAVNNSIE